jgi:hypothetical protein
MLSPSGEQVRLRVAQTGLQRKVLTRLLGFRSDNSLRQCEQGLSALSPEKAAWLAGYAALCVRLDTERAQWLAEHPPLDQ